VYPASRALIPRKAVHDARPSLAAVGGAPDERDVGILAGRDFAFGAALAADARGDIRGADGFARFNRVEARVLRHVGDIGHVVPLLTRVHRVVDLAVAAYGPEDARLDPRNIEIV